MGGWLSEFEVRVAWRHWDGDVLRDHRRRVALTPRGGLPVKGVTVRSLTWRQVSAWRLAQHCLSPRLKRQDFVQAATRTGGIHAQVMSAAEMALWARADGLCPEDVRSALWQERTLVKTWAMRGTLHLISASELPLYIAARGMYKGRNWHKYFTYYGITPAQYEAFLAAVPQVLGSEPMTREELAAALAEHVRVPELRGVVMSSGWGSPLKPSALRGDLCFGPNRGRNVTFVRSSLWIGEWRSFEPHLALQEMVRRYLWTYGPATPESFARWWELGLIPARKLFQSMQGELEAVDVEGQPALALRTTLEPLQGLHVSGTVNLLPLFDAYVLGLRRDVEPYLPTAFKSQVFRPQGWVSPVVLVDGHVQGVWEHKIRRSQTIVKVRMFSLATALVQKGIEAETERLGAFLNTKVVPEYENRSSYTEAVRRIE
jgi:hypothetical protein